MINAWLMTLTFDINVGSIVTGVALFALISIIGALARGSYSGFKHLRAGVEGLYKRLDDQDATLKEHGNQLVHNDACLDKLRDTVAGLTVQVAEVKGALIGRHVNTGGGTSNSG